LFPQQSLLLLVGVDTVGSIFFGPEDCKLGRESNTGFCVSDVMSQTFTGRKKCTSVYFHKC
jgi:hypothetical protein